MKPIKLLDTHKTILFNRDGLIKAKGILFLVFKYNRLGLQNPKMWFYSFKIGLDFSSIQDNKPDLMIRRVNLVIK